MLELRNVTKWYRTARGRHYVFRDLNFRFPPGSNVGLIGRNGAGKSTLLRMIGGLETPNQGEVLSDARISWPVGMSGGFQGSLSALENVQFVCRVYGSTGAEMRRKIDFVREFAEIGEYFELPVRTYSAGMRGRVAFGLSMAFDFEIYLVDEAMAAGDPQFRAKGARLLTERLAHAHVILVSHNMADIRRHCNLVVHVDRGNTVLYEDVEAGIAAYQKPAAVAAKE